MRRTLLILALLVSACSGGRDENTEATDSVPIGPGSDTTVLIPPDTPVTPNPGLPARIPGDTLRGAPTTTQ